jgi:hypothetical protein
MGRLEKTWEDGSVEEPEISLIYLDIYRKL